MDLIQKITETVGFIKSKTDFEPEYGVILGTGLGGLIKEVEIITSLSYDEIPHFPISTVESHHGKLVFGMLSGKKVVAMLGRFHYYEGYSMEEVTFPVRVMKFLGISRLFVSNACGSVNPSIRTCDLMVLNDHINLLPENPLRGRHYPELGPRFPDLYEPYDREMIRKATAIARENKIPIHVGTYASVQGPNLETAAEYKMIQVMGADVVGMSTIPEVLVAVQMGLKCFAISVVTDEGWHEILEPVTVEDVIAAAQKTEPKMTRLIKALISSL
ncbi:MAG: purine-nucleoside phosphorylase [Bacteroidia bacterium]